MTALPVARPSLSGSRFAHQPVSRSDGAIIERKIESRFNCRDESDVNASTVIICRNQTLTTQTRTVA
jgi:hypothetical protein